MNPQRQPDDGRDRAFSWYHWREGLSVVLILVLAAALRIAVQESGGWSPAWNKAKGSISLMLFPRTDACTRLAGGYNSFLRKVEIAFRYPARKAPQLEAATAINAVGKTVRESDFDTIACALEHPHSGVDLDDPDIKTMLGTFELIQRAEDTLIQRAHSASQP